jgi:hypothetical protein
MLIRDLAVAVAEAVKAVEAVLLLLFEMAAWAMAWATAVASGEVR